MSKIVKFLCIAIVVLNIIELIHAGTIYCTYTGLVPQNYDGNQGKPVFGCSASITRGQRVYISHYDCGNAYINAALWVDGYRPSNYITIGPGQRGSVSADRTGTFSVYISTQSGGPQYGCRLEVVY